MRVLLIGGTGFTGPAVVRELLERGQDVVCVHRGQTHDPRTQGAREVYADRRDERQLRRAIVKSSPDVVVDMIPFTEEDAIVTKRACDDVVPRLVALSSIDVYLAFGRIHGTEPGPQEPTPLTEESALRATNQRNGPDSDKIAVERTYLAKDGVPATILRLPAIYGPHDKYRRLRGYLKRMDDGRPAILLGGSLATWKFSRGYVDNVAHAVVLAVECEQASGDVFNVAEPDAMTELDFVRAIGDAAGWNGEVKVIPDADVPRHLQQPVDFAQDWNVSTEKIRTRLGYAEILDIPEAFRRTVVWERDNPPDVEPFELDYDEEDRALAD